MVTKMGAVGGKRVAAFMAVHVAVVLMTVGVVTPSGALTRGMVPTVTNTGTPVTLVGPVVVPPVDVVVVA